MLSFKEVKKRLRTKEKLLKEVKTDLEKNIVEEDIRDLEVWYNWHIRGGSFGAELGLSSEDYKRWQEIKKKWCSEKGCELENGHDGYHAK